MTKVIIHKANLGYAEINYQIPEKADQQSPITNQKLMAVVVWSPTCACTNGTRSVRAHYMNRHASSSTDSSNSDQSKLQIDPRHNARKY